MMFTRSILALAAAVAAFPLFASADEMFSWGITLDAPDYPTIMFDADNIDSELMFQYSYTGTIDPVNKYLTTEIFMEDCLTTAPNSPEALSFLTATETTNSFTQKYSFDVDVRQDIISDSSYYTLSADAKSAVIKFCVRVDYMTTGAESVNFHEVVVTINVDLEAGFQIQSLTKRDAADEALLSANLDYQVIAYFCDDQDIEIDPPLFAQGDVLQYCVRVTEELEQQGIYVKDIIEANITQLGDSDLAAEMTVGHIWERQDDPLTLHNCPNGKCNVMGQLVSKWFDDPSPGALQVDGIALLGFGDPNGYFTPVDSVVVDPDTGDLLADPEQLLEATSDQDNILPTLPDNPECGTVFAYLPATNTCFIHTSYDENGQPDFNRYGWSIGPLAPGIHEAYLYRSATQCDLEQGTLVGQLHIDYRADGSVLIDHMMFDGLYFEPQELQFHVGTDVLATSLTEYTIQSDQYPFALDALGGATTYEYEQEGLSGEIYVVSHTIVCDYEGLNPDNIPVADPVVDSPVVDAETPDDTAAETTPVPFACGSGGRRMHCNQSGFNVCSNGTPGQELGCCSGYYYLANCDSPSGKCCLQVERRLDFLDEEVHSQDLLLQEVVEAHRANAKKGHLLSARVDRQDDQLIQARVVMPDRFLQQEEAGGGDQYGVTAQLVGSGGEDNDASSSGVIIGGVIAGVAVVAMVVAFVVIRRVRREEEEQDEDNCGSKKSFGTRDEESAGDVVHLAQ